MLLATVFPITILLTTIHHLIYGLAVTLITISRTTDIWVTEFGISDIVL